MPRKKRLLHSGVVAAIAFLAMGDVGNRPALAPPVEVLTVMPARSPVFLPLPDDLVALALADLRTVPLFDRPFVRYLSIQDGDPNASRTSSLALNYISRSSAIYRPWVVAGGVLLRVDLRSYAPRLADLEEWLQLWEEFRFDPSFALLITKDTLRFIALRDDEIPRRRVAKTVVRKVPGRERIEKAIVDWKGGRYVYPDDSGRVIAALAPGKYEAEFRFRVPDEEVVETVFVEESGLSGDADVLRLDARHISPAAWAELTRETRSQAPIVDHRYFLYRALSTIEDKGVYKTIWGGLYYQFRGVKRAKEVLGKDTKASDLDLFFESLGIGNIKAGVTQEKLFEGLRSDQRAAVFRSGVTGKPRDVTLFHVPADKEGGSFGAITGDVGDGDVDVGDRAFANLLAPRRKAREAIFPAANGLSIFGLFNGEGARQDEVPPDVAVDTTIPASHTRRLQAAIGCIRCHGTDGSDGWKPLRNDVRTLLDATYDILGDLGKGGSLSYETRSRLIEAYTGNFDKALRRARDDVAEVTLRATGPWKESADQTDVAKIAAIRLADDYSGYWYDLVTPRMAIGELGVEAPELEAVGLLNLLLPPDGRANFAGLIVENPAIMALKSGIGVNRSDWSLAFPFAAERARKQRAAVERMLKR